MYPSDSILQEVEILSKIYLNQIQSYLRAKTCTCVAILIPLRRVKVEYSLAHNVLGANVVGYLPCIGRTTENAYMLQNRHSLFNWHDGIYLNVCFKEIGELLGCMLQRLPIL